MISHVFMGTNDFPRALAFYSAVLNELGLVMKFSDLEKSWAGWITPGVSRPLFVVSKPYDGQLAAVGNGQMAALLAPSREAVDRAHAMALAHGAVCEGPPGLRLHYHANYYGAYFRDVDGNKLCVCCHDAPAE